MIGNTARIEGVGVITSTKREEFAAWDVLGPHCRNALNFVCLFRWSAQAVLNRFSDLGLDPHNPDHDSRIATELVRIDAITHFKQQEKRS